MNYRETLKHLLQTWLEGDFTVGPVLYDLLEELNWPWVWTLHKPGPGLSIYLCELTLEDCWLGSVWRGVEYQDFLVTPGGFRWNSNLTYTFLHGMGKGYLNRLHHQRETHCTLEEGKAAVESAVKSTLLHLYEQCPNSSTTY